MLVPSLPGIATIHKSYVIDRMLGVTEAPGILLSNVKVNSEELPNVQNCCGFGETFQMKMTQFHEQMVDEKVDSAQ